MKPPLQGMRVLDLSRLLPGNVCTFLLRQLGAEIIKIEDPDGGDYGRSFPPQVGESGAFFQVGNRGKRSIILDLKHGDGRAVLHRLVMSADVLVEGFRPGVMARLGCDEGALRARNPRLVYCALAGWGQEGPYAQRSGHDLNYIAAAGLVAEPFPMDATPPPAGQIADVGGAYLALAAILAALLRRETTDRGAFIDVSLAEAALPFALFGWVEAWAQPEANPRHLRGGIAAYANYRARCGKLVTLSALEAKFWQRFAKAVGRDDWLAGDHTEAQRQQKLRAELRALFATQSAAEWEALLGPADCCFEIAREPADWPEHPQHRARAMSGIAADGLPWLRSPLRLSETTGTPEPSAKAPGYGADTRAILAETGYSQAEIAALLNSGAARAQSSDEPADH